MRLRGRTLAVHVPVPLTAPQQRVPPLPLLFDEAVPSGPRPHRPWFHFLAQCDDGAPQPLVDGSSRAGSSPPVPCGQNPGDGTNLYRPASLRTKQNPKAVGVSLKCSKEVISARYAARVLSLESLSQFVESECWSWFPVEQCSGGVSE